MLVPVESNKSPSSERCLRTPIRDRNGGNCPPMLKRRSCDCWYSLLRQHGTEPGFETTGEEACDE